MRVLISGATGFVGRALVPALQQGGHTIVVWARDVARARARLGADVEILDSTDASVLTAAVERCHAVINLAGEPVVGARWTEARRAVIRDSRVRATDALVQAIATAAVKPQVLVSASAVGYYGDRGDEVLSEDSSPGSDFLAQTCHDWEAAAVAAEQRGVRVVLLRIGVVLGRDGGALEQMLPPFRIGLGGPIGGGRQYLPWIHLHDLVGVVAASLTDDRYRGPVNAVAPDAVTNLEFARQLGRALNRPAMVPVPALALKVAMGAAASVLLASQRVRPDALSRLGFPFAFPTLAVTLADIVGGADVALTRLRDSIDALGSQTGRRYLDERRPIYELRTTTVVNAPIEKTFEFFSKAENLGLMTPSAMGFSIRGAPPRIAEDTIIDYRVLVGGLPINWRTRIVTW
ncbi:MAG: TIGR01777 family oxidoreductase, partial [Vicinamibacterales bacterium]